MKRRLIAVLLLACAGCLETGCSIHTKNQGEIGFSFGTNVTFFSRSAKTGEEEATVSTEFPSVEAWIFDKSEPKAEDPSQPTPNP